MARTYIEVYGDKLAEAELIGIGDRAADLRPLWPAVLEMMEEIEKEQFDTQGSRSGSPWPELSRETLLRKFRSGQNMMIMRATDALYDSLTGKTSHSVRTFGSDWAVFGSTLPQMAYHQDRNPSANYPERLPVDLTQQDSLEFAEIMLGYIVGTHGKHGIRLPERGAGGRFVSS